MTKRKFKVEGSDTKVCRHQVMIEISDHISSDNLHELLCKAILEGDQHSLQVLMRDTSDIKIK